MAKAKKKKLTKKEEKLLASNAGMKISPFQTWEHPTYQLLKMTGDKKRYGGSPTRTTINKGNLKNKV